jgi:chemotaxis protein methyltransferase CheR
MPLAISSHSAVAEKIREFDFGDREFDRIRHLIYEHAGINLAEQKKDMVYSRLARRLRATGLRDFRSYLERLEHDGAEWEAFVNSLTTNLTSFFREEHHFPILAELLRRKNGHPVKVWCSAASTGEEPYSIAMTAMETYGSRTPAVEILATDIDTNVLAIAKAGIYSMDRIEKLSDGRRRQFFLKGTGAQQGKVRVRPELQALIRFQRLNLLERSWSMRGPVDAIFCRNVLIYFDKPTQYAILKRFAPLLAPDGLLFVGHSEALHHATDLFRLRGKTVYELAHGMGGAA